MTHGEIIKAYKVIVKLCEQRLPLTTAYKLHTLRGKLKKVWDFQGQEERKLFDEYKPEFLENGELLFKTPEEKAAFEGKINELTSMKAEAEIEPVSLPMTDDICLAPDDIDALLPVVRFNE